MAASFTVRGCSISAIATFAEGELRYREFNDKKHKKVKVRLAEIHLGKIGKLDRAEKRDPNAAPPDLPTNGEGGPFLGASSIFTDPNCAYGGTLRKRRRSGERLLSRLRHNCC